MTHTDQYIADQKKYRKIRKHLRQIEHLQLLTRELNHEEKQKVSKKKEYREQLNHLTHRYMNEESFFSMEDGSLLCQSVNDTSLTAVTESVEETAELEELEQRMNKVSIEDAEETKKEDEKIEPSPLVMGELEKKSVVEEPEFKVVEKKAKKSKKAESETQVVAEKDPEVSKETLAKAAKKVPEVERKVVKGEPKPKAVEVPKASSQPPKSNASFRTTTFNNAHEDLIVSVDLCIESNLIATGSRDTSIKVWSFKVPNKIQLLHSFGGHSSPITQVKLWKYELFKNCLENTCKENEDAEYLLEKFNERDNETAFPMVVSSSLDQSIRIWDITDGRCVKELYLYNRANCFDIHLNSFVVGLDGGKIQYWNNLIQSFSLKCFEDTESVCCVKQDTIEDEKRIYGLSHTGQLKVFKVENQGGKESMVLVDQSDVYDLLSESHLLRKNFKCFELLNRNQALMINDNQSFVIFHDIAKKTNMLISTNTNNYGFTNCLVKLNNKFLISAYNIDDASNNINVFEFEKDIQNPKSQINYQYTLEEEDGDSCISTMSAIVSNNMTYISSGSGKDLTLWKVETTTGKAPPSNKLAKCLKMCKHAAFQMEDPDNNDDDSDSEGEDQNETEKTNQSDDLEEEEEKSQPTSRCTIQ